VKTEVQHNKQCKTGQCCTLYVRKIRLSCERSGSSGGSSHEEHATKNALGTVTEEGEYSTEGLALIKAIRPAKAWSFS
jgi:hypothetical protein